MLSCHDLVKVKREANERYSTGLWGGRRRGTFRNEVSEGASGGGNIYAGASPRMKRRGGRTDEQVLLLADRPDRAEGRTVLYANMYGEWIK